MKTVAQASSRIACALMVLLAGLGIASLARAGTGYVWTSTGPSAAGYWTNSANWNPASGIPGAASGDSAYLTNTVGNAYTSLLDMSPAYSLANLALSNSLGTAALVVTQRAGAVLLTVTNKLTLATGGQLEIGIGCTVSNASTFVWVGTNGQVVLDNGGTFITAGSVTISNNAAGFAGQIANFGASVPGGLWDLRGQTLTIRGGGNAVNTLTASGVTLTNLALIVGTSAGANQNALTISNGGQMYVQDAGPAAIGKSGASSNTVTIAGTNSLLALTSGIGLTIGDSGSVGNVLIITNGGQVVLGGTSTIGNPGTNNTLIVSGTGSVLNAGAYQLSVGSGAAFGNLLRIENGGAFTQTLNHFYVGNAGGAYNSVIVTNGGQFWSGTNNDPTIGYSSTSNTAWIGGNGAQFSCVNRSFYCGLTAATGNVAVVDNGGSLISCGTLYVLRGLGSGNTMIITNGGQVVLSGADTVHVAWQGSNSFNNVLLVVNGGLLEAQKFYVNNSATGPVGGNSISNSAGIYQFTNAAPAISLTSNGMVYLVSGTISFRAITNADVFCNQAGKALDSTSLMSWSGTNAFRLNNATNTAAASQSYTFDSTGCATNYARLEMMHDGTRYRGQAGNTLTIGANGQMLCSNTAAVVDLAFTNNGTLTLVNSTLTFATNAVLNGKLAIDLNSLATNNGVVAAARNLTLGSANVLTLTGAGTNVTLITYAGTLSGSFGTPNLPPGCQVNYGTRSNSAISLKLVAGGSVILLR